MVSASMSGIEHYEFPDSVRENQLSADDGDRFVESMPYVPADPTGLTAAVMTAAAAWSGEADG
jgi:hypothetical protein